MRKLSINRITIVNLVSTFLLQAIAFLTIPIFTRMLGATNFGIYSTFESWVKILVSVMGLGVFSTIGTGKYRFKDNYLKFCSSTLLFGTIIGIVTITIGCIFCSSIAKLINYNVLLVILVFVAAFGHSVTGFIQNVFSYEKRAFANLFLSITISLGAVLISMFLIKIYNSEQSYMGRIWGAVIPYIVVGLVVGIKLYLRSPTGLRKEYCIFNLPVGFPIVFHSLSQNILGQSDRVMMQNMGILSSEIGIYSFFYSLTSVLGTILNALNTSWCPFYYDYIENKEWDKVNKKSKNYIEVFSVLVVGYLLLSREVSFVMADSEFWEGLDIIPVLAIAIFFTFMYQFPVNYEFYLGKTKALAIGTIISGIMNIVLNYLMIPLYGMYGAAIATALSYLFLFLLHFAIVHHMRDTSYDINMKIFIPGIILVICGICVFYLLNGYWYIRWPLGAVIGIVELIRIKKRKSIF